MAEPKNDETISRVDDATTDANLAAALGVAVEEIQAATGATEGIIEDVGDTEPSETAAAVFGESEDNEAEPVEDGPDPADGEEHAEADTPVEDEAEEETIPFAERTELQSALARDGLPQELIESLTPDQLRAYGAKRAEKDAAFADMKEDIRSLRAGTTTSDDKATPEGAPTIEPDNPLPEADLSKLVEEFGEGEAKEIASFVSAQVRAGVDAATKPLIEIIEQSMDMTQRSRLEGVVPDGLSDDDYARVRETAIALSNAGRHSDITNPKARQNAIFDMAMRAEGIEASDPAGTEKAERRAATKRRGAPSGAGQGGRSAAKLTLDQKMQKRADMAAAGKTVAEILKTVPH